MLTEMIRNLRSVNPSLARHLLLQERLVAHLQARPIDVLDLNPHLQVQAIAVEVAGDVTALGFSCTSEDVLLAWLTVTLTKVP